MEIEDLKKAVGGWLENQGYPLEMRVSRLFSELGFGLRQGWFFQDPEEEKPREIDILARVESNSGHPFMIMSIVECKWTDKPFVVFSYSNRSLHQINPELIQATPVGKEYINFLSEENLINKLPLFKSRLGPLGYSMIQAQISFKEDEYSHVQKSKKDEAFDALIKVSKATYSIVESQKSTTIDKETSKRVLAFIALPTIVIDGPLFDCYLNDKNEIVINNVQMAFINWSYPKLGNIPIRVYTISELETLAEEIQATRLLLEEQEFYL